MAGCANNLGKITQAEEIAIAEVLRWGVLGMFDS